MERVHGTGGGSGGGGRERRRLRDPEPGLRPFAGGTDRGGDGALVSHLEAGVDGEAADEQNCHDAGDDHALAEVADNPAERARQGERDEEQQVDLEPVGPTGRILDGCAELAL